MVFPAQPSRAFRALARLSLAAAIITAPLRYRWVLQENLLPPIYPDFTNVLLFISDGFLLATLISWTISLLVDPRHWEKANPNRDKAETHWQQAVIQFMAIIRHKAGESVRPAWLTMPVFALVGVAWLTAPFSSAPLISYHHALRLTLLACVYLFCLIELEDFRLAIPAAWVQVFLQSVIGIAQVMRQRSVNLAPIGELKLDPAWNGVSIVWSEGQRSLRAYGLTDHPNILGGVLAFGLIVMMLGYFMFNTRWRALVAAGFSLGSLALLLTFSRTAWLAFCAGTLLLLFMLQKSRQPGVISGWLSLVAGSAAILAPFLWHNASHLGIRLNWGGSFQTVPAENQAIGERRLLNQAGLELLSKYPITGVGLGTFPLALQREQPDWEFNFQPAHLALLDAAAELGLLGGLVYATALATPWVLMLFNRRKLRITPELAGASALLLALTIVGFFDYYTWLLAPGRLWQWLAWGLWAAAYQSSLREGAYA